MRNLSMTSMAAACALALGAGLAAAEPGYLDSSRGIVKSGAGLCWHTGSWTPDKAVSGCDPVPRAQAPAAPAPAPIAQPAPPPPAPAAKPPAPVLAKVTLDTQLLFDFDSAQLRDAGRARLYEIAQKLHGATVESISAVGHADRIASDAYNAALSEERAHAVREFLVKLGFDAKSISAEGRGESEPVTAGRCNAMGPEHGGNLKLVACLQPDRRVELEIRGTRKEVP